MARLSIFALLCALPMLAQEQVRIEGTVLNAATGFPVQGAKVVLSHAHFTEDTGSTDASGAFRFVIEKSGSYTVDASAPGFQPANWGGAGVLIDEAAFEEGAKPTVHTVTMRLKKAGAIQGRVRDGGTSEPLAFITVRALHLVWVQGRRRIVQTQTVLTGANGDFRFETLPAGDYLLEISAKTASPDSVKQYPVVFWPGNDPDGIPPINLQSGGELNVGTIDYLRQVLPRLRLATPRDCQKGLRYQVNIAQLIGNSASVARQTLAVECPAAVTVDSLAAGRYALSFNAGVPVTSFGSAELRLEDGADLEVELRPDPKTSVSGQVKCECEKPSRIGRASVWLRSVEGYSMFLGMREHDTFQADMIPGTWRIGFRSQPEGTYIKEVRRDGVPGSTSFTIASGEAATVDVMLSDRAAVLGGAVMRDGKPDRDGHVVLARWPLAPDEIYPDFESADADANSSFTFEDLAPGKYRVVAVSEDQWAHREEPHVIAGWFTAAQEITLEEKQTAHITVEAK